MRVAHENARPVQPTYGRALAIGGGDGPVSESRAVQFFDPATGDWAQNATTNMNHERGNHAAVVLPDDRVLAVGGCDCPPEVWDEATWTTAG